MSIRIHIYTTACWVCMQRLHHVCHPFHGLQYLCHICCIVYTGVFNLECSMLEIAAIPATLCENWLEFANSIMPAPCCHTVSATTIAAITTAETTTTTTATTETVAAVS